MASAALLRAALARRSLLYAKRGIADPHLHPSEFMKLTHKLDKLNMYIAIGHGQHEPSEPPVRVPHNVYLVFLTPPGYYGVIQDAIDPKFLYLIHRRRKFIDFMKGKLPPSQLPNIVKTRRWNWKRHIYPPGTYSAAHTLQLFDKGKNDVQSKYDKICGLLPITNYLTKTIYDHGTIKKLKNILEKASRMAGSKTCMVFVSGCRGDPRISERMMNNVFRIHTGSPPTYNLPMGPNMYIPSIRAAETNLTARLSKPKYNKNLVTQNIMRGMSRRNLLTKYPGNNNIRKYIESLMKPMNWSAGSRENSMNWSPTQRTPRSRRS